MAPSLNLAPRILLRSAYQHYSNLAIYKYPDAQALGKRYLDRSTSFTVILSRNSHYLSCYILLNYTVSVILALAKAYPDKALLVIVYRLSGALCLLIGIHCFLLTFSSTTLLYRPYLGRCLPYFALYWVSAIRSRLRPAELSLLYH